MIASASPAQVRDWITGHLDPLDADGPPGWAMRSDFDLNPHLAPPATEPLTHAAVLIGLIERPHGLTVILTRRADTLRMHTGQVALPGGRRDPGETPWQTAVREAYEEIGLDPALVTPMGLSTPYRTVTNYCVAPVVGFIAPGATLTASIAEVAEIFEPPLSFLMDPANYEEREGLAPSGERRRFYAMTWEGKSIWGATAGMLRALHDRLYGAARA